MKDSHGRTIDYLRISLTDRCNFRCIYCMPEEGVQSLAHEDILRIEEIEEAVRVAAGMGIRSIRLTGGEPLVRLGVVDLVRAIAHTPGIENVSMTTNGVLLPKMAVDLKEAGLSRVNISLDPLTQLNNRTHLAKYVAQKMRHRDAERTLCLFIVDVDHFKQINDTYGHVEGDRALQRVADALRHCSANRQAFVARYGGDEFVIVREAAGGCDARQVSERLNAELARVGEEAYAPYEMRVSVGGAPYGSGICTLQDFIRAADKELYQAKANRGR